MMEMRRKKRKCVYADTREFYAQLTRCTIFVSLIMFQVHLFSHDAGSLECLNYFCRQLVVPSLPQTELLILLVV